MNANSLVLSDCLKQAVDKLTSVGIATARLDALVLLEDATGKDRAWLLAHPDFTVQGTPLHRFRGWVERRVKHEPLSYIRGKSEFYGRTFKVNAHTLEPRPETETMIALLMQAMDKGQRPKAEESVIIDIGTGSGVLAITAKLELPGAIVLATDIDPKCLKTARENAKNLGADIKFIKADLIQSPTSHLPPPISQPPSPTIILCNLPYVPNDHTINQAAMFEPKHAIFGGLDGLDLYRTLFDQIGNLPTKPAFIFTESLPPQHKELEVIAKNSGYELVKSADLINVFAPNAP